MWIKSSDRPRKKRNVTPIQVAVAIEGGGIPWPEVLRKCGSISEKSVSAKSGMAKAA